MENWRKKGQQWKGIAKFEFKRPRVGVLRFLGFNLNLTKLNETYESSTKLNKT